MPVVKVKGGFRIKRSLGGLYPKIYKSKDAAEARVAEMEMFKHIRGKK